MNKILKNDPRHGPSLDWGDVEVVAGAPISACERCQINGTAVVIKTRDGKKHRHCKECLGIIIEFSMLFDVFELKTRI